MPYKVVPKKSGGALLIKRDTGKVVSRHDSVAKAEAAIRAIYANESANKIRPSDIRRRSN